MQADELAARGVGRTVSFLSLRVIDPVASVDLGTCGKKGNRAWLDHASGGVAVIRRRSSYCRSLPSPEVGVKRPKTAEK
jgi:hypothetical protein